MKRIFSCEHEKSAKLILMNKGLKSTPQRLAVIHVLHSCKKYLSIIEILDCVKELLPKTGLATIYRTLDMFVELGLIMRLHFLDGCHSYTISPKDHSHQMVCTICDTVFNFSDCPVEGLNSSILQQKGFKVNKHFVQLFGECADCRI
ncbi:MAG: Fur family transcriptional regulator [Thermodesulfobacteriota bacterium]